MSKTISGKVALITGGSRGLAAFEQPDIFVAELRKAFRTMRG
ncbi:MAG: hypothetical protein PW790_13815 [Parvibaculaceae bacterium]|nr:hypothetical protein [Parvibaculaceae bacterium]